jgi:hypothetical protein
MLGRQLDLISALLAAGSLPVGAALPLVADIEFVVSMWGRHHADISAPLLESAIALRQQIERGQA